MRKRLNFPAVQGFESLMVKNLFLQEDVQHKIKTSPVNGLVYESEDVEYIAHKKVVFVRLAGNIRNPLYGHPLLLDRDFWEQLPTLRWRGVYTKSNSGVLVLATNNGEMDNLSGYLMEYLGVSSDTCLYTLGHPLDRRRVNLTTSNISSMIGDGMIGLTLKGDYLNVQAGHSLADIIYLGTGETDLIGQQLYNAVLFESKMRQVDLRCFGRVEERGRFLNMFPDSNFPFERFVHKFPFLENYYTASGTLKPKYRELMREHQHLVAPITDKKVQARLKRKGTPLSFTCLDRTPFNR